ncbi:MBL fold metallo-hydrolase [Candidatus Similichlamydia laticola]|uniref:Metal dependent hydrolase n=1 Tax=Candidatus Similichlamydia laticola TaxID=2170265 RepID=A0A369KL93_9BACT|nr:MBL fold metallo-hydrolase [Candidatus Similichlamydia laticola]RDB31786.1 metal dependent hydrolase [Candidatus Similichlamydia laticola]
MLLFCPLASGSRGNAYYLRSEHFSLLIDAGCSGKVLEERMRSLVPEPSLSLDAILLSHEHFDHISALARFAFHRHTPVLATPKTCHAVILQYGKVFPSAKLFVPGLPFTLFNLDITPFSISHDAVDPVAFRIDVIGLDQPVSIGICTDLGFVSSSVVKHLEGCTLVVVEANHDPELVMKSSRPLPYKKRVLSKQGHLSNEECADLLERIMHPGLERIYLSHLSEECNSPELALQVVRSRLANTSFQGEICLAPQESCALAFRLG